MSSDSRESVESEAQDIIHGQVVPLSKNDGLQIAFQSGLLFRAVLEELAARNYSSSTDIDRILTFWKVREHDQLLQELTSKEYEALLEGVRYLRTYFHRPVSKMTKFHYYKVAQTIKDSTISSLSMLYPSLTIDQFFGFVSRFKEEMDGARSVYGSFETEESRRLLVDTGDSIYMLARRRGDLTIEQLASIQTLTHLEVK